jgi:cytoskeletal protein CcmA (bactofilin family)
MSLFRRDDRRPRPSVRPLVTPVVGQPAAPATPSPSSPSSARGTSVGPAIVVVGRISGGGPVEIAGRVEGSVDVGGRVVVAAGGTVVGDAVGRVVRIEGRVEGRVIASERAELGASASVEGDVEAPRVAIAEGAFLRGSVKMGGDGREGATAGEST